MHFRVDHIPQDVSQLYCLKYAAKILIVCYLDLGIGAVVSVVLNLKL
jgi:hypothetical protein